jgi:hypothetical protein
MSPTTANRSLNPAVREEGSCCRAWRFVLEYRRQQIANAGRVVVINGFRQALAIKRSRTRKGALPNDIAILRQPFQVVQQINEKKFLTE